MALEIGSRLGHYDVTALIGEGGMGQVYRATDTQLGRDVALKILPDAFAADPDRLARFQREAQVLASLNHPGIAAIYGIEKSDDTQALVLELVEGPTLADRIAKGPIPLDEALPIAKQIAEALEAAHDAGVIHRDLKPANIKVREDGTVKVLDFGLAKALDTTPQGDPSQSPTLTAAATQMGVILGTAAYMSPEQARGQVADRRADVWAFGAVLYEMLTGGKVFDGATVSDTIAATLKEEPDWSSLPSQAPAGLRRLLRRCLTKDPRQRLQHIGEARIALVDGLADRDHADRSAADRPGGPSARTLSWMVAVPVAIALLLVGAGAAWLMMRTDSPVPTTAAAVSFDIQLPEGVSLPAGIGTNVALSPDGGSLVYVADEGSERRLYLRRMNEPGSGAAIPGTADALRPFFSPDGEWVVFKDGQTEQLRRVSLSTHEVYTVVAGDEGSWGLDGNIVFTPSNSGAVWRVPAVGGEAEFLMGPQPDRGVPGFLNLVLLPGDRAVLFESGYLNFGGIGVLSLESGDVIWVSRRGSDPLYSHTGHVLYSRGESLVAVPFDIERLEVTGSPVPVLPDIRVENGGAVQAALSSTGCLVSVPASGSSGTQLMWLNPATGDVAPVSTERRRFSAPRLSPNGDQIAVVVNDDGDTDVWIVDVASGGIRPLTTEGDTSAPVWSPDGSTVSFASGSTGRFAIQSVTSGGGSSETVLSSEYPVWPECWHVDGERLVFRELSANNRLFVLDVRDGSRKLLVESEGSNHAAQCSPDGRFLAYESDRGGTTEVYLRAFDEPGAEVAVSVGGGRNPVWGPDGSSLTYHSLNETQMNVASLRFDPRLQVVTREVVPDMTDFWGLIFRAHYDVHPADGRFLFLSTKSSAVQNRIRVVLDWSAQLERTLGSVQ